METPKGLVDCKALSNLASFTAALEKGLETSENVWKTIGGAVLPVREPPCLVLLSE